MSILLFSRACALITRDNDILLLNSVSPISSIMSIHNWHLWLLICINSLLSIYVKYGRPLLIAVMRVGSIHKWHSIYLLVVCMTWRMHMLEMFIMLASSASSVVCKVGPAGERRHWRYGW